MVFAALIGGLVGARLFWIVENSEVKRDLLGNLFGGTGPRLVRRRCSAARSSSSLWARWRGWLGADDARHRRGPAGARLRDRAHRLPALRATATTARPGTGPWAMAYPHGTVPTDRRDGPPDADLRDARDGPRRAGVLWRCATACARACCSRSGSCSPGSSASSSSSCAATRSRRSASRCRSSRAVAMIAGGLAWLALVRRRHGSALLPRDERLSRRRAAGRGVAISRRREAPSARSARSGPAARRRAGSSGGGRPGRRRSACGAGLVARRCERRRVGDRHLLVALGVQQQHGARRALGRGRELVVLGEEGVERRARRR